MTFAEILHYSAGVCLFRQMKQAAKKQYPNLVVYCSPAEGGGTIRKNSHFVSSAIHIKIGRKMFPERRN